MNIQDALKETGKGQGNLKDMYVELNDDEVLCWYDISGNCVEEPVSLSIILDDDWQPYCPVEEIRPEKAGELWEHNNIKFMTMVPSVHKDSKMYLKSKFDVKHFMDNVIHNQNGWTRLYPPVKEQS